ncbi:MAG TPA: DUF6580 family putative transport protein [Thermoanaerobaculia bacterium]|nr:DUF6580 family putative transport protein [Thermoanaerobaculia bacterium]
MRFTLSLLLVALGVVLRVAPHPLNFAPVGAIALFAGATFENRRSAFLVPLVTMFIGDLFIGLHSLMPVIYATYALIVILGMALRSRRRSVLAVGGAAIASATIFFIVTNFAVWLTLETYPLTLDGLAACYAAAIPFFDRTLASDLLFSAIFFGAFALAERRLDDAHRVAASKRD